MAGICCGLVGESETTAAVPVEPASTRAKRLSSCLELRPFKFVPPSDMAVASDSSLRKRSRIDASSVSGDEEACNESERPAEAAENSLPVKDAGDILNNKIEKFGMTSVCGRRRDMEDAVSIRTVFTRTGGSSFFGVFDGHGCSHVAMRCRDRLHEIVQEEMDRSTEEEVQWEDLMARSFICMDRDVEEWTGTTASMARSGGKGSSCRCELQAQQCDAVGSTAVVSVVTAEKIIVSNCGDSRAVLCRNGVAIPLSTDHKPDRPDELERIEAAGGRVIYWDGPRVLGVLAMSRAIGDNYLKPYVIPLPEVTVTERTDDDECLILASDGLWDVVTNETACGVAAMCLRAHRSRSKLESSNSNFAVGGSVTGSDKECSDASILLTKLALARHSTDNVSVVVVDLRRNKAT